MSWMRWLENKLLEKDFLRVTEELLSLGHSCFDLIFLPLAREVLCAVSHRYAYISSS